MNRGKEVECTQTCRSRQHGAKITAAIIRGTEAQVIAYMKVKEMYLLDLYLPILIYFLIAV